jgi:hypothetical protein
MSPPPLFLRQLLAGPRVCACGTRSNQRNHDGDASNGYQGTLAFAAGSPLRMWLLDVRTVDGATQGVRLRQLTTEEAHHAAWSPDLDPATPGYQGRVAFTTNMGIELIDIAWDGNAADPSTFHGASNLLIEHQFGMFMYPSWSHDGTRIAMLDWYLWGQDELQVIDDLNDPQPRFLVSGAQMGAAIMRPYFSRTDSRILFSAGGGLYTIDADAPAISLTSLGIAASAASWSPDDTMLTFERYSGKTYRIYTFDFATSQATLIAGDNKLNYRFPHWRPF